MSDYHRIYLKLVDLLDRGHRVAVEKHNDDFEVTVFEDWAGGVDHEHTNDRYLSDAMDEAHRKAISRWPKEDD